MTDIAKVLSSIKGILDDHTIDLRREYQEIIDTLNNELEVVEQRVAQLESYESASKKDSPDFSYAQNILKEFLSLLDAKDPVTVGCHCTDVEKCCWCRAFEFIRRMER